MNPDVVLDVIFLKQSIECKGYDRKIAAYGSTERQRNSLVFTAEFAEQRHNCKRVQHSQRYRGNELDLRFACFNPFFEYLVFRFLAMMEQQSFSCYPGKP